MPSVAVRVPLTLLITWALYTCYDVSPAPKEERVKVNEGPLSIQHVTDIAKLAGCTGGAIQLGSVLVDYLLPRTAGGTLKTMLEHLRVPDHVLTRIRLTPLSLTGAALIISGTCIRKMCYRAMGRMFTGDLSVRRDHRLVTHGPYSIVRHPSYMGGLIANLGVLCWFWSRGSIFRELNVPAIRAIAVAASMASMRLTSIVPSRVVKEDTMMREKFGDEWEMWASRVRWRLFPGIY
ncbi:hypothetical protein AMATHDRAFT_59665 [Amanita thiersii Skay4041]|uniref:Protein-S-isoprenylcysteine O-methyltransferase n=1 Tax=Amanita thiersii Skay4041 TaxID=703135 RepID=A0A2A9NU35_9AGAR|nr:hypothetical protein AMATHDRAFT_59665 [Amanita thiersii Skay4041]